MTEDEIRQNRLEEIKALQQVNEIAKSQRIAIEDEIERDPYTAHLYQEQQYMQLIFLELRELNTKLDKFLAQLPQLPNTTLNFPGDVEIIEQAPGECYEKDPASILHGDGGAGPETTPRKRVVKRKR